MGKRWENSSTLSNKKGENIMNKKSQKQTVQVVTLITSEGKKVAFRGKYGIYVQMPKQEKKS